MKPNENNALTPNANNDGVVVGRSDSSRKTLTVSPGKLLNSGLSLRDLRFLLYYLGRVGDVQGNKARSAEAAGHTGCISNLIHHANRILRRSKTPLDEYLQVYGAGLTDCVKAIGDALKAKNRKAFMDKFGDISVSRPFLDADAHRVRISAADRGLALGGHITKRTAITVNVDQVREDRKRRSLRDLKQGPDGVYE